MLRKGNFEDISPELLVAWPLILEKDYIVNMYTKMEGRWQSSQDNEYSILKYVYDM